MSVSHLFSTVQYLRVLLVVD